MVNRDDSNIVFVGYAVIGALARRIIDGAKQVNILGEDIPVRARIYTINGFSAHADQAELLAWQKQTSRLESRCNASSGERRAISAKAFPLAADPSGTFGGRRCPRAKMAFTRMRTPQVQCRRFGDALMDF
jgi:predicted metal-dependent RNase